MSEWCRSSYSTLGPKQFCIKPSLELLKKNSFSDFFSSQVISRFICYSSIFKSGDSRTCKILKSKTYLAISKRSYKNTNFLKTLRCIINKKSKFGLCQTSFRDL